MELNKKGAKDMSEQIITQISIARMRNSRGDHYGFNYYYGGKVGGKATIENDVTTEEDDVTVQKGVMVLIPEVTSNKRSVNDIGWMVNSQDVKVFGTISQNPEENDGENAFWQELSATEDVNKVCTALMFVNKGNSEADIAVRVIMC
jgi:hypothetical protein